MSHHFRCNRCRGRNVMPRHWRDYSRPKRCKHCGHDRFYVDKERVSRAVCRCGGAYHWPAHRPGSLMCELHPLHEANRARRQGAADDVVAQLIRRAMTMSEQIGLDGVEEAPAITALHVAVLGMLWKPTRIVSDGRMLEAWLVQPGSSLPVFACIEDEPANLAARERRLQRIGTPVLARGFGIEVQCVEDRECLRIGLCSYLDVVPAEERLAA